MSVADITNTDPVKLAPTDTVGQAARLLVQERALALPVVEESGKLLGMFGLGDIARLLLPRAVTLNVGLEELPDLDFVADNLEDLRKRLDHIRDEPVKKHLPRGAKYPLDPDSSFTEALFLIHRTGRDLPVLERTSGKLVGMITPWDVLDRLD